MWHAAHVKIVCAAGVDGFLLNIFESYLANRYFKVTVDDRDSRPQPIRAGVHQRSCFGPLLWNIYINDLLHLIPSVRAYAGDLTMSAWYKPEEEVAIATKLNTKLSHIFVWGKNWQVKFAAQMTVS